MWPIILGATFIFCIWMIGSDKKAYRKFQTPAQAAHTDSQATGMYLFVILLGLLTIVIASR